MYLCIIHTGRYQVRGTDRSTRSRYVHTWAVYAYMYLVCGVHVHEDEASPKSERVCANIYENDRCIN